MSRVFSRDSRKQFHRYSNFQQLATRSFKMTHKSSWESESSMTLLKSIDWQLKLALNYFDRRKWRPTVRNFSFTKRKPRKKHIHSFSVCNSCWVKKLFTFQFISFSGCNRDRMMSHSSRQETRRILSTHSKLKNTCFSCFNGRWFKIHSFNLFFIISSC
jgi:hypothetical protein